MDGFDLFIRFAGDCAQDDSPAWLHGACAAHFDQALKAQGKHKHQKGSLAQQVLKRIQLLYRIEKQAKGMSNEQRTELRQSRAVPVLDGLGPQKHA